MKNNFILSLIGLSLILLTACKDELDLTGGAIESAVVIGILDQTEHTHYIKVTRSFIGDGITSSIDIAQIADSSYFSNVDIEIQEILSNGSVGRTFNLVDTMINEKNTNGIFYAPDQKVYVFYTTPSAPLIGDATYKMKAIIDGGKMVITGETKLVGGISPSGWSQPNAPFKLTKSSPHLEEYENYVLTYASAGSSYKLNCKVNFEYREYTTGLADSSDHSIEFNLGEYDVTPGFNSAQSFVMSGENFYNTLRDKIPVSNSVEKRVFLGFSVTGTGASRELANYIEINKPSTTLAQNKPTFTNLKITEGYNVMGIFASRYAHNVYRAATGLNAYTQALDKKSRRELCVGPRTQALGFCSNHTADGTETWHCD